MRSIVRLVLVPLFVALITAVVSAQTVPAAGLEAVRSFAKSELDGLFTLYRHLHTHPELSFAETETAKKIARELEAAGFTVTTKIGGEGVVGVLKNGDGPVVMVRTDLDALPVEERTALEYASRVRARGADGKDTGVMHACGHDVHMTVFVGCARALARMKSGWKGTLVFIGQPAEERGKGALSMLADGLYSKFPRPDRALALHCAAALPAGKVTYVEGYALANVDSVDIVVRGVGGHGAYPHTTKDPIVLASQIVLALQTLTSREKSPLEPAVVTVGSIHGGTKHNIIPDEVKLEITCRSYSDPVRRDLLDGIRRIARGTAIAAGIPEDRLPTVTVLDESIPSTYNDPALTKRVAAALADALGKENVQKSDPVMGGEDFGCYGRTDPAVPISMFWLGAVPKDAYEKSVREKRTLPSLHSAEFAPDARTAIETGVVGMTAAVLSALSMGA